MKTPLLLCALLGFTGAASAAFNHDAQCFLTVKYDAASAHTPKDLKTAIRETSETRDVTGIGFVGTSAAIFDHKVQCKNWDHDTDKSVNPEIKWTIKGIYAGRDSHGKILAGNCTNKYNVNTTFKGQAAGTRLTLLFPKDFDCNPGL